MSGTYIVAKINEAEQVAGTNDATSLQLKLRRALQERDHFARVYEAARIERDTMADQNRTLKIERDRYREERDQAYGWVNQSVREINELRGKINASAQSPG
jgi:hypothetical protein